MLVIDPSAGSLRRTTPLRGGPFLALALSPDGSRLAAFDAGREERAGELSPELIASQLAEDPGLLAAYRDLRAGLANRRMRETVLNALKAFARSGEGG
jgi:hypothetical protein